jgi:hypothetical protein
MTEGVLEGAPLLEAGIYRLMTSPNITFLLLVKVVESIGSNKALLPLISTIRHNFLSIIHDIHKCKPSNFDVRPRTTRKRPMNPHHPTSLNAQTNFIPQPRAFELVRKPLSIKWMLLPNSIICAINGSASCTTIIKFIAITPINLK